MLSLYRRIISQVRQGSIFLLNFIRLNRFLTAGILAVLILLSIFILSAFFSISPDFKKGTLLSIPEGATLGETATILSKGQIIDSSFWFKVLTKGLYGDNAIKAGDYFFDDPQSLYSIAGRIARASYGLTPIRVTIPEGSNVTEIGAILTKALPSFSTAKFLKIAEPREGYLFPDTYAFIPNVTPEEVVKTMQANFNEKIKEILPKIEAFSKKLPDIIIMASLLEEEARLTETRRTVAGILWKRLSIDMPLQVDAVFKYILGKNKTQITFEDLKIESPYNTYLYRGLPPGPISNPGIDSIWSAVTPIKTKYFYYLTGKDGNMRYAVTFDEHVRNKELYLR